VRRALQRPPEAIPGYQREHVLTVKRGDVTLAPVLIATVEVPEEVVADVIGVLERGYSPFPRRPDLDAVSRLGRGRP
jgi:hypothetical protein